jgi:hypothetical protein
MGEDATLQIVVKLALHISRQAFGSGIGIEEACKEVPSPAIERLEQRGGRARGGMLKAGGGILQAMPAQRQENAGPVSGVPWRNPAENALRNSPPGCRLVRTAFLMAQGVVAMTICKGIVKDNVVLLEAGVQLPEGAEVEVRLLERPLTRQEVFARVRTHRILRPVGMDEIIAEDKQEQEEHPDTWWTR